MVKKGFCVITVLFFLVSSVFSMEWGGLISNDSSVGSKDFTSISYLQSNSAYLWLQFPIGKKGDWYFIGEGMYKYKWNVIPQPMQFHNIVDIDTFKVSGSVSLKRIGMDFAVGRYIVTDASGHVFSTLCDGVSWKINFNFLNVGLYGGYTGFTNGLNTNSLIGQEGLHTVQGEFYKFNPGYVPAIASFNIPVLLFNQSVGLEACAYFDFTGSNYHRYYGTVTLGGPLLSNLFYNIKTTFGTENFTNVMNTTSVDVMLFIKNVTIKAGGIYASGEHLNFLSPFKTVTSNVIVESSVAPELTNCIVPYVDVMYVSSQYYVELNVKANIRSQNMDDLLFKGIYGTLSTSMNVFCDFRIGLDLKVYYDIEGNKQENLYSATLKAVLSF